MIKFLDLKNITASYWSKLTKAITQVINSGWYLLGKESLEFEKEYEKYCGTRYFVGVSSWLDALHLVLKAWGIGNGDEVIVPTNTYIANWLAVSICGAKPIPVEPNFETYYINPYLIEKAITKKQNVL